MTATGTPDGVMEESVDARADGRLVEGSAGDESIHGAETDYRAVGFIVSGGQTTATCAATLVAPRIVLTAAHCVENGRQPYAVGFSDGSALDRRNVTKVHIHPAYQRRSRNDFDDAFSRADVAVLELDAPVTDREPAQIASPMTTCNHRFVRYEGGRKSTESCLEGQNAAELLVRSVGGSCRPESDGPLMVAGTNKIVGVLSRSAPRKNGDGGCDAVIMTKLDAYFLAFIAAWAPNAIAPGVHGPTMTRCMLQDTRIEGEAFAPLPAVGGTIELSGLTDRVGAAPGVLPEIGVGPVGTVPAIGSGWNWYGTRYAGEAPVGERWATTFTPLRSGSFALAYRVSTDNGRTYTICDGRGSLTVR